MFLESERFDRVGATGRRGVVTVHAVDADLHGRLDRWAAAAARLQRESLLSAGDAARLALLDAFAESISNTDRHFGNVAAFDDQEGAFTLEAWPRAHALALDYWSRLAADERRGEVFQQRARECREVVVRTAIRCATGLG